MPMGEAARGFVSNGSPYSVVGNEDAHYHRRQQILDYVQSSIRMCRNACIQIFSLKVYVFVSIVQSVTLLGKKLAASYTLIARWKYFLASEIEADQFSFVLRILVKRYRWALSDGI